MVSRVLKSILVIFLLPGVQFVQLVSAEDSVFISGEAQVTLVELFTSEGCSSCPPADRWLSSLKHSQDLWTRFVPISFHVDYWDYIGWQDKFADKKYSQRQRRYAKEFNEPTVYTPGVRKAGKEWRSWRFFSDPTSDDQVKIGKLRITVSDKGEFTATFLGVDTVDSQSIELNIALLGMNLTSQISRGENKGKLLKHDFVTLGLQTMLKGQSDVPNVKSIIWQGQLPTSNTIAPNYALAAWVTKDDKQQPLQVVGGYM